MMNAHSDEEDEQGGVFLDEADIMHEEEFDGEDLLDVDDEEAATSDAEMDEEADDPMHIFTGHSGELYTVACSPTDSTLVATGGGDNRGCLWKIGQGVLGLLQGHNDSVSALAFSADGQLLATGSLDGLIKIWDVSSGHCKCKLEGTAGGIEWVRWHPRVHEVLAGSEDSTVWTWDADSGAPIYSFIGHGCSVTCGDYTPDGERICTGSDDATLKVWDSSTGERIHTVKGHLYHTEGLTCLVLSSDSTLALTGSKDGSVHIVNIRTGKVVSSLLPHLDSIECVGFSPSSRWAATGGMDKKLIIWDMQHSSLRNTYDHKDGVTCLTWLGASRYVATGCVDGSIHLWDNLLGNHVRTFRGHLEAIQSLAVSANRDFLVSVSLDGTAQVFEIAEFK